MALAEAKNDKPADLVGIRSVLFLPASNARAIVRARDSRADLVVLDLEDAVKLDDKPAARKAATEAVSGDWPMPVAIRVNAVGTQWHSSDVEAVGRSNADIIVLPRATSAPLVADLGDTVGKPVLAMIETAAGVFAAEQIATQCAGLIAGTNDLRSDLRLPLDEGRGSISVALQTIVLAARAAGVACFDGVYNGLQDKDGLMREALEGRAFGFDGKSLIHPDQIEPCHAAFRPSAAEVARAQALIEAFQGGAERFGDEMIERMHIQSARRVLERASK